MAGEDATVVTAEDETVVVDETAAVVAEGPETGRHHRRRERRRAGGDDGRHHDGRDRPRTRRPRRLIAATATPPLRASRTATSAAAQLLTHLPASPGASGAIRRPRAVHSRRDALVTDPGSWRIAPVPFADVRRLADELGVSEVLAQVLVRRGLGDPAAARAFLHPDFRVHDPYLMSGMAEARRRIDQALQRGEPIAVHGDYDADGITATFLLVSVLGAARRRRALAAAQPLQRRLRGLGRGRGRARGRRRQAAHHRGLRHQRARRGGAGARRSAWTSSSPTITSSRATCPTASWSRPRSARIRAGISPASASPSSWRTRCSKSPGDELVDLPLALRPYTDLVAVGTIADVVPLVDENRVLTAIGLGRLRSAPRPGLAALLEVAGGRPGAVDAGAVGFRLGAAAQRRRPPRGRLARARAARRRRPRRGAAARAPAQRAQPRAAGHRGGHARGGGGHGPRPAAGGARALVAGLARGRGRHRRVARRRELPPSGDPAQRGRRRGQGLRPQHPRLRPPRRRRAQRRTTC